MFCEKGKRCESFEKGKKFEAKDATKTKLLKDLDFAFKLGSKSCHSDRTDGCSDVQTWGPLRPYFWATCVRRTLTLWRPTGFLSMRERCSRFITTLVDQIRKWLSDKVVVLKKAPVLSVPTTLCIRKSIRNRASLSCTEKKYLQYTVRKIQWVEGCLCMLKKAMQKLHCDVAGGRSLNFITAKLHWRANLIMTSVNRNN